MARTNNLTNFLNDVSFAIKQKTGDSTPIPASEFDTEILSIETAGTYQSKSITIDSNGTQVITPDENYDAIEQLVITVNVPVSQLQSKAVTITSNGNISVLPDTDYNGMAQVDLTVNVPTGQEINNQDKTITENGVYTADSGYTGLGTVTVNVPQQGGSGDVKLFETEQAMRADPNPSEGDLAVVYRNNTTTLSPGDTMSSFRFLPTVTFETKISGLNSLTLNSSTVRLGCNLTRSAFEILNYNDHSSIVHYNSSDALTYIRTDGGAEIFNLGEEIVIPSYADENILKFFLAYDEAFEGLYEYDSNNGYEIISAQLDATADYVYEKTFYGKNGVTEGTLTETASNSFTDTSAAVYSQIKQRYDNMTPRVLTDSDKTIDKNIYVVPEKTDGTPLLDTSQVTDMSYMFYNCKVLTSVSLLDTGEVTNMANMFRGCTSLTTILSLNTSEVTSMTNMFSGCSSLTSIPLLDTSNVTNISYMFSRCSSLTSIPLLNTSNVTDMSSMFYYCSSLTTIPLLNTSNVTSMASMFYNCTSLISIPLLSTSKVTNMDSMFNGCTSLTSIPLLDTGDVTYMGTMFSNCTSLSNESLNNILAMCTNAAKITSNKTLRYIGLTSTQATTCQSLSNYSAFTTAGWKTGY